MLIALFLWLFAGALFFLYGRLALWLLKPACAAGRAAPRAGLLTTLLAGLVTLASLVSLLSLLLPLSALSLGIVLAGVGLIVLWEWRADRFASLKDSLRLPHLPRWGWVIVLVLVVLILDLSTRRAANPDTGIYHAQAIRWMETYPAVPGLGNLHTRFAYNSAWLTLNAQFSLVFLGGQSFHALPGLWMAVFALAALLGASKIIQRQAQPSDWLLFLLLPLAFYAMAVESASPGTDLPAVLVTWLVLWGWMREREATGADAFRGVVTALAAVFALTVKLSAVPLVLFALLEGFAYLRGRLWRRLGALALGGVLILAPWCARNGVLSGYLVYPLPEVDWFNLDWKIPAEVAQGERMVIQAWARIPREEKTVVQAMPLATWAKVWYLNKDSADRALLWGVLLAPLGMGLVWLLRKRSRAGLADFIRVYGAGYAVLWAGLLYWFFSAPDLRFGWGLVLAALVLGWLPLIGAARAGRWGKPIATALLALTLLLWGLQIRAIEPRNPLRLLVPREYTSLSTAPCALANRTILCAEWYGECGYSAFPCIPSPNPEAALRGAELRDGFRSVAPGEGSP